MILFQNQQEGASTPSIPKQIVEAEPSARARGLPPCFGGASMLVLLRVESSHSHLSGEPFLMKVYRVTLLLRSPCQDILPSTHAYCFTENISVHVNQHRIPERSRFAAQSSVLAFYLLCVAAEFLRHERLYFFLAMPQLFPLYSRGRCFLACRIGDVNRIEPHNGCSLNGKRLLP